MFYFLNVKSAESMLLLGGYGNAGDILVDSRLDWVTMGVL